MLDPGFTNLILSVDFVPGAGVVGYTVTVSDPTQPGTGVIIATDGASRTCNVTVQIDRPPPQNVPPNAEAGPAQNTDLGQQVNLDGSGSNDPDNGPNPLTFQWAFAQVALGSTLTGANITNATSAQASFTPDVPGDYQLRLDVSDGENTDSDEVVVTVPPTHIPNVPPTASNVLISGTPHVGQVLAGSYDYADSEGDLQGASTFRWLRTNGEIDIPIDGATALTYTLVAADEGALIKFEVTPVAQSGISPGLAASAVVGPVVPPPDITVPINLPPTANNVLISGNPQVGRVLTGSYTYADAEGDLQGASTFRWLRNNVALGGATARSYALVAADEGTLITFKITPVAQNGASPGLVVTSDPVGPVTPAPNDGPTASDLELISLTATPALLTVNGQLTYTITVRNKGPAAATGVHVIDALPPGAAPVPPEGPADSSQGQCSAPSPGPQPQALTVECDLGMLPPSAEATVTINVMPTVAGELINTAQVAAFETDPNPANNSKTETTPIRLPVPELADLAVTAAVGPRASGLGLTYTLTVTNHGPAAATRVQLANDLPRDIEFVSFAVSQGSCDATNDPVLCDLGALATDAAATVTIDVVIRTEVEPDTLPNRAQVNADQDDPDRANNFALTSALELPRPQTACNSTRCSLRLICNESDFLERRCDNQVITLFVEDTRAARRDTRARRLSDERAARRPRVRFAAGMGNMPGGQTEDVRLRLTPNGKKLARTLSRQGKKKLKGMMEIKNHMGGGGTDKIRLTVRLK